MTPPLFTAQVLICSWTPKVSAPSWSGDRSSCHVEVGEGLDLGKMRMWNNSPMAAMEKMHKSFRSEEEPALGRQMTQITSEISEQDYFYERTDKVARSKNQSS